MKSIKTIFSVLLICFVVVIYGVDALAIDSVFSYIDIADDRKEEILENINLSKITDEPEKKPIDCFSVNESGEFAIGCNNLHNKKTVSVYSPDGEFLYGYRFESSGDFGIDLQMDSLIIYFARSSLMVSINSNGEVNDIFEIENTSENNSYWRNYVWARRIYINEKTYELKNQNVFLDFLATSSSLLTVTNELGEETVIYDAKAYNLGRTLIELTVFITIAAFALIGVIKAFKNNASSR